MALNIANVVVKNCGVPNSVPHGSWAYNNTEYNHSAILSCDTGYFIMALDLTMNALTGDENATAVCLDTEQWSLAGKVKCNRKCPLPSFSFY